MVQSITENRRIRNRRFFRGAIEVRTMNRTWNETAARPQLRRRGTQVLGGNWTLNGKDVGTPWTYWSTDEELVYVHDFVLSADLRNDRVRTVLRFGAVDQICDVTVNGKPLAHHEGGYLPFDVDITDVAIAGLNRLTVRAVDTLDPQYPYGKQTKNPHGMWYTPVSGIWQPVCVEAVPVKNAIRGVKITPDLKGVTLELDTDAPSVTVQVTVPEAFADEVLGYKNGVKTNVVRFDLAGKSAEPQTVTFGGGPKTVRIDVPAPRLWTPEDPFLYGLSLDTGNDRVDTYFALRTVSLEEIGGHTRFCLNGKPVFLHGVLDQGYWGEDGYLPASPDAYIDEVRRMKALGFNCIRKHIKIEPEAFYEACDRAGMLVLQDMVNSGSYSFARDTVLPTVFGNCLKDTKPKPGDEARRERFERDMKETVALLYNHPSVVGYTIFNEGWGQFDSDRLYGIAKTADPTRFFDATSGWFAQNESDCESVHVYFRSKRLKSTKPGKMLFLSECGGFTRPVEGHTNASPDASGAKTGKKKKTYGYGAAASEDALTSKIEATYRDMVLASIPDGLAGCIYTQNADVEGEINGLYTADRAVCKVDGDRMRAIARAIALAPPYAG
jgi:beta-galactosidase/beta-glucuronidase